MINMIGLEGVKALNDSSVDADEYSIITMGLCAYLAVGSRRMWYLIQIPRKRWPYCSHFLSGSSASSPSKASLKPARSRVMGQSHEVTSRIRDVPSGRMKLNA